MARDAGKRDHETPRSDSGVKRRGLLRLGTLITAFTGASALTAIGVSSAQAGPGDKTPSTAYVPVSEKGAPMGVATLDLDSKIPRVLLPDLSATFVPKDSLAFEAMSHGIKADGFTNDAPALNSLITAISAAGGGTLRLPMGRTTRITSSVVMKSNVALEGHGYSTVISLGANVNGSGMITIGAVSNVTVRNLRLIGNSATNTQTNSGIWGAAPGGRSNILIEGVTVEDVSYAGIAILGDTNRVAVNTDVKIVNCTTANTGAHGLLLQWGVDNGHIINCTTTKYAQLQPDVCGITNGRQAYDTSIKGCFVDGTGALGSTQNGISLDWAYGRCVCVDNTVVNCPALSIEIGGCADTTVANNTVTDGSKSGIQFTGYVPQEQSSYGVTVTGNTITRCTTGIGFQMGGDTTGISTPATRRATRSRAYSVNTIIAQRRRLYKATTAGISAATIPAALGNTVAGATVSDGMVVWTDLGPINADFTISGNVVKNCTAHGIEVLYAYGFTVSGNHVSRCAWSGIKINQNCNGFAVTGNDLDGNNTAAAVTDGNLKIETLGAIAHVGTVSGNSARDSGLAGTDICFTEGGTRIDNRLFNNLTTPTVAFSDVVYTSNTRPTSITNFLDANSRSRTITVFVNDTNTTFVHTPSGSTGIRLADGVNYSPPVNTVMQFIMPFGGQWFEVSRVTTT